MAQKFWMYHKEYAPTGRIFDQAEGVTPQRLAQEGWVDSAAKCGVNVWAQDAETDERVREIQGDFDAGRVKAIDDPHMQRQETADELDQLRREKAELQERLRAVEGVGTQVKRSKEEAADKRAKAGLDQPASGELHVVPDSKAKGGKKK